MFCSHVDCSKRFESLHINSNKSRWVLDSYSEVQWQTGKYNDQLQVGTTSMLHVTGQKAFLKTLNIVSKASSFDQNT